MTTRPLRKTRNFNSRRSGPVRHLPQRTCVACRQVKAKRELVRLVRTPRGDIEIDVTGKKEGRGAYLCPTLDCLEKALKGKQLEHTFKSAFTPAHRERLAQSGRELLKELSG
ncbi:MAG: YlxR family protein [Dehalococcoidales bacterium]